MPTEQGTAAMILYRNDQGQTIVYYVRPPGNLLRFGNGNRQDGNLLAQYWRQGRYSYARGQPHRYAGDAHLAAGDRTVTPRCHLDKDCQKPA